MNSISPPPCSLPSTSNTAITSDEPVHLPSYQESLAQSGFNKSEFPLDYSSTSICCPRTNACSYTHSIPSHSPSVGTSEQTLGFVAASHPFETDRLTQSPIVQLGTAPIVQQYPTSVQVNITHQRSKSKIMMCLFSRRCIASSLSSLLIIAVLLALKSKFSKGDMRYAVLYTV